MDALRKQSQFLFDLYAGSRSHSAGQFEQFVFDLLRRDLHFDSGLWVSGAKTDAIALAHTVSLDRQPAQFLIDYEPLKHLDQLRMTIAHQLGATLNATSRTSLPEAFTPYLDRYGLEHALSTMLIDPDTALYTCVSLYRSDLARPFSEQERQFKESIFPHLVECCTQYRLRQMTRQAQSLASSIWRSAIADRQGLLHYADAEFTRLLRLEWPDWRGPTLPSEISESFTRESNQWNRGKSIVAKGSRIGDVHLCEIRLRMVVDTLSDREREVAQYAARGLSHKEIARVLRIAPSTIRNHLAAIYRRLNVATKTEMANVIRELE